MAYDNVKPEEWHDITKRKKDLPKPGEHVIICMGYVFVGEGYMKDDGKWYRYCDFGPVDEFMSCNVVGWQKMPKAMPKPEQKPEGKQGTRPEGTCDAEPDKK